MKTCTTGQAAGAAKISRATLQDWIRSGKISAPRVQLVCGKAVRLWTTADIKRLRAFKRASYWKGGGRPRKKVAR